ncbi:serine/threonine-protein kinase [Kitasatospora purpeofusca]|uniref:serine/threonine-protein kinase n=1 Tax=Kitasatospora purpeofusca TaxID=67352 RepID=UPI0022595569|nr:serine/threonine-protein kinase [Kitasatospora purpeofusca]MCX4754838.1 serine/threonine protein kinase [Kitasatospora purpeofusca]WSR34224.1 serine/threonine protein kinase [Kitasatospora purpeofusca]WSR42449.1 serine/threonine protein kinase [Kitasatospora purpeofusca]
MTADTPRDAAAAPLPPVFQPLLPDDPREVGGYRLFARLGAGGMGRVYLSYTPGGRPVALKVVRPEFAEDSEFRRRFAQEVSNAQRIHGLYTAQVIDSGGLDSDAPWLVTAYVPGPSLQQVVRENGALPVRTVLLLMGGIAEALQAIHSVEVVHRDLKPANVLVAGDGPRVIDFGIARAADATALTGTGYRIGSPAFMSPEQAQGRPVTPATDVFALGALAAYVATGSAPFGDGPDTAVLYRVVHEQPDLDAVPADLRELVLRCLAKSPEDRPRPAEIIELARNHPSVGGQLRFADDWLPRQVNTEITRRSDLPKTPPTPLPAAPPLPSGPPTGSSPLTPPLTPPPVPASPAGAPATHAATAPSFGPPPPGFGPARPDTPPPGFVPPPLGAYGAAQPTGEAPTGPLLGAPPTVPLRPEPPSYDTPPPGPVVTDSPAPAPEQARSRGGVSWKVLLTVALVMAVGGTAGGVALMAKFSKDDDKNNSAHQSGSTSGSSQPAAPPAGSASAAATTPATTPSAAATSPTTKSSGSSAGAVTAPPSASSGPGVTAPARPTGYSPLLAEKPLSIPGTDAYYDSYRIDLDAGTVVPRGTDLKWGLGLNATGSSSKANSFVTAGDNKSDFAVITESAVTPDQCAVAIDSRPDTDLSFNRVSPGRLLCIRDRITRNIAVAVVEVADVTTGAVKLTVSTWRAS